MVYCQWSYTAEGLLPYFLDISLIYREFIEEVFFKFFFHILVYSRPKAILMYTDVYLYVRYLLLCYS